MKNIILSLLILIWILSFTSCEKIPGNAKTQKYEQQLQPFNGILLQIDCELTFKLPEPSNRSDRPDQFGTISEPDTLYKIIVWAQSDIFNAIETPILNGNIVVRLKENKIIKDYEPIRIDVFAPDISFIQMNSPGSISININDSLKRPYLECYNYGTGTINLHSVNFSYLNMNLASSGYIYADSLGSVNTAVITNSGTGRINLLNVTIDSVTMQNTGKGDISACVRGFLDGTISSSGNIYYLRADTTTKLLIKSNITGTGKLIRLY
jgi:hypothetical protein